MGAQYTSNIFIFRASGVAKATEESNITAPSICAVPPLNVLLLTWCSGHPGNNIENSKCAKWPSMITAAQLHVQRFVLVHLQSQNPKTKTTWRRGDLKNGAHVSRNSAQCQNLIPFPPSVRKSCAFPVTLSKLNV